MRNQFRNISNFRIVSKVFSYFLHVGKNVIAHKYENFLCQRKILFSQVNEKKKRERERDEGGAPNII